MITFSGWNPVAPERTSMIKGPPTGEREAPNETLMPEAEPSPPDWGFADGWGALEAPARQCSVEQLNAC
jgi:hypothetical protein